MNYNEALSYIHGTYKFGIKQGLENSRFLLELMGNPQKKLKFIHVAGTNGKGSTCSYLSSILKVAGYKTGLYISPYIQRFTERISINGLEIPEERLAEITSFVKLKIDEMLKLGKNHPTEFEVVTAIAFQYYMEEACDIVVLEVGLGGRFDATNIIDPPELAVITTISLDHSEYLGNELTQIAFEKAGIIKTGTPVVIYPNSSKIMAVFENACKERGAKYFPVDFDMLEVHESTPEGEVFSYNSFKDLKIKLPGEHQAKNAVVAINTLLLLRNKGFLISDDSIKIGLANAEWPGRFEIYSRKPWIVIDGAHNEECAYALKKALDTIFPNKKRVFIFGIFKDKPYKEISKILFNDFDTVITLTPENPRALNAKELAQIVQFYCKNVIVSDTIYEAVTSARAIAAEQDVICAFGSFSFLGQVKEILKE